MNYRDLPLRSPCDSVEKKGGLYTIHQLPCKRFSPPYTHVAHGGSLSSLYTLVTLSNGPA